jgi:hypothetical protein
MANAPIPSRAVPFDVASQVPAGSTIVSAAARAGLQHGNTGPSNIELHRVLADWGEGASNSNTGQGAPSQTGDATWIHRFFASIARAAAGR